MGFAHVENKRENGDSSLFIIEQTDHGTDRYHECSLWGSPKRFYNGAPFCKAIRLFEHPVYKVIIRPHLCDSPNDDYSAAMAGAERIPVAQVPA